MSARTLAATALTIFALATGLYVAVRPGTGPARLDSDLPRQLVVTYFHGKVRCRVCNRIEAYSSEAVQPGSGRNVVWREVDVDEPLNEHFVADYGLLTRSVVVSEVRYGREVRWKNLDRIWELLDDRLAFERYIRDEVAAFGAPQ